MPLNYFVFFNFIAWASWLVAILFSTSDFLLIYKLMIQYLLVIFVAISCHRSNQQLKITYVTGLWDVSRGDMVFFKRTFEYYLSYLRDTISTNHNIIIFGNQQVQDFVEANRKYQGNIFFINKPLTEIQKYWYTAKIWQRIDEVKKDWLKWQHYSILPQYGLRMYNPVVMSKMRLLMEASQADPFNSDYLVWIDGAITHALPKMTIEQGTFGKYFKSFQPDWMVVEGQGLPFHPFEIGFKDQGKNYANITTGDRLFVWGNWLGGKASAASTAYHVFQNFLRYTLENGEMNTDESILFLMLERYSYIYQRSVGIGIQQTMRIEYSIVDETYALRQINASDILQYSAFLDEGKATCDEPVLLREVYHQQNDIKYFKNGIKMQKSCLKVRIVILAVLVVTFLCIRSIIRTNTSS